MVDFGAAEPAMIDQTLRDLRLRCRLRWIVAFMGYGDHLVAELQCIQNLGAAGEKRTDLHRMLRIETRGSHQPALSSSAHLPRPSQTRKVKENTRRSLSLPARSSQMFS